MFHDICESSVIHVVLTCISSMFQQYTRTTNRSSFRVIFSDMFTVYGNDRVTNWTRPTPNAGSRSSPFLLSVRHVSYTSHKHLLDY